MIRSFLLFIILCLWQHSLCAQSWAKAVGGSGGGSGRSKTSIYFAGSYSMQSFNAYENVGKFSGTGLRAHIGLKRYKNALEFSFEKFTYDPVSHATTGYNFNAHNIGYCLSYRRDLFWIFNARVGAIYDDFQIDINSSNGVYHSEAKESGANLGYLVSLGIELNLFWRLSLYGDYYFVHVPSNDWLMSGADVGLKYHF